MLSQSDQVRSQPVAKVSREKLLQLIPQVAVSIDVDPERLKTALISALDTAADRVADCSSRGLRLELGHHCRNSGCHDSDCQLCVSNPHKKCIRQMNTKYMVRETLRSGCGMGLNMRLIYDQEHGSLAASPLHTAHHEVYVQVCAVNARAYELAVSTSGNPTEDEDQLDHYLLPSNKQGGHLLDGNDVTRTNEGFISIPLNTDGTEVPLPRMTLTESSEGLLGGQKPPVQLLFRAVDAQGQRVRSIPPLLSDEFLVTTIRSPVKKPEIPLVTDPVSKLQAIGKETVAKLKDLTAAAAASPNSHDSIILQDFCEEHNSVCTVQDFQALMQWCGGDLDRSRAVQRVLKITRIPKGWETATAHAASAVSPDNRSRMFTTGSGIAFMYKCRQGKVDLSTVTDCVRIRNSASGFSIESDCSQQETEQVQQLQQQAISQWNKPGHPGWAIAPQDLDLQSTPSLPEGFARGFVTSRDSIGSYNIGSELLHGRMSPSPSPRGSGGSFDALVATLPASGQIHNLTPSLTPATGPSYTASSLDRPASNKRRRRSWENTTQDFAMDLPSMNMLPDCASHISSPGASNPAAAPSQLQASQPHRPSPCHNNDQAQAPPHFAMSTVGGSDMEGHSPSSAQSPDLAALLGVASSQAMNATVASTIAPTMMHAHAESMLNNLQGMSQLSSHLANTGSRSSPRLSNEACRPIIAGLHFPSQDISQAPAEQQSSDLGSTPLPVRPQALRFVNVHPFFSGVHTVGDAVQSENLAAFRFPHRLGEDEAQADNQN